MSELIYPVAVVGLNLVLDSQEEAGLPPGVMPHSWEDLVPQHGYRFTRDLIPLLAQHGPPVEASVSHRKTLLPRRLKVTKSPYREADKATIEFEYSEFPFDPRLIRAARVVCWIGNRKGIDLPLETEEIDPIFTGFADDVHMSVGEDSRIRFECRDMTSILLDAKWGGDAIDLDRPLTIIVRSILARLPVARPMRVELRGLEGMPIPDLTPAEEKSETGGDAFAASPDDSYWDVITNLVAQVGFVAWVDQDAVVIGPGQSVTREEVDAPTIIWGENLQELSIKREIGRRKGPPIRLVSWNPDERKTITAVYPEAKEVDQAGDGASMAERPITYVLSLMASQQVLRDAAEAIYRRRAMMDIQLTAETRSMTDPAGYDMFRLRAGSPIRIKIADDLGNFLHRMEPLQRGRLLYERGYEPEVARAIGFGYDDLDTLYQVVEVEHDYDADTGYTARIDAASYLDAGSLQ